jgi:nitrate reductase beta subunit
VEQCIGKIRGQGFVSDPRGKVREDHPIDYLVHVRRIALPLYPQFGTAPNVYYLPPVHVPPSFLEQIFGPGARHAVETYRKAREDDTLLGLLQLFGSSPEIMERFEVEDGVARAWDREGVPIAEVPITEPPQTRVAYDRRRKVHRLDVT